MMKQADKLEQMDKLERAVLAVLDLGPIDQTELIRQVLGLQPILAPTISDEDVSRVIARLESQLIVIIEGGTVLQGDEHEPWLDADRRSAIAWQRWNAYRKLLSSSKTPPRVLQEMGQRADVILGLIGDPQVQTPWQRRGLVIGDVQSGKTANYLGLFNKAADAGYKVIILLGGHTDKLRKQTQKRVDEGFVGKDSRKLGRGLSDIASNIQIGVGRLGIKAAGFTTVNSDFSASQLRGLNLEMEALSSPVIFVIKKNKTIINNLVAWLASQATTSGKLSMPMLLLDDEADYASINTNDPDKDPTAINQGIRDLLGKFERNSFVGFTATPYANVLIDDEIEEDLFPRDFIYALEAPSNYFGPEKMFSGDDDRPSFIRHIYDAEDYFPIKHKSSFQVVGIPASLKRAVMTFFLTNAIRDLRGQEKQPRSMLVNVSRYNLPQQYVTDLIANYVSEIREALIFTNNDSRHVWDEMQEIFTDEFANSTEAWPEVSALLGNSIEDIVVKLVNSKNKSDDWESIYETDRARVIAVGGDVLSRGLTLEGLSTSYFYRKSVAYDTLMQMGRWFGYRGGYEDVCRLWIDQEVSTWYAFIASAIRELRDDLRAMRNAKLTPKDFGLAVLRHPGSVLTVTAQNKSKHGQIAQKISLRNYSCETPRLPNDKTTLEKNWKAFAALVQGISDDNVPMEKSASGHPLWRGVTPSRIVNLLENFRAADAEMLFTDEVILSHVRSSRAPWMQSWDVMVMGGQSRNSLSLIGEEHKLVTRAIYEHNGSLYIGGSKMRLGGRGDIAQILDSESRNKAIQDAETKEPSDANYRRYLKNPLLIIYPIEAKSAEAISKPVDSPKRPKFEKLYVPETGSEPIIGLHFSFPPGDGVEEDTETVSYMANKVYVRNRNLYEDATEAEGD
jgi:hypothetical protein